MCNLVCPRYLTQDIWRWWLDQGMSGTNEMLLLETCLCVYVCICVCLCLAAIPPTPSISSQCISPSRSDMRWHSLFIYSQGHAPLVSLCRCHQSSKHWRREGNTVITAEPCLFVKTALDRRGHCWVHETWQLFRYGENQPSTASLNNLTRTTVVHTL